VSGVHTDITPICEAHKQAIQDCDYSGVTRKGRVVGLSTKDFQIVVRHDLQCSVFKEQGCNSVFVFSSHSI